MTETNSQPIYTREQMRLVANAINRQAFARAMGGITAYGGDRDYWMVLGYEGDPSVEDYRLRYKRQDVAKRVVDLPCTDTWKLPPKISENDNEETEFVKAWEALVTKLKVWNILTRTDILSGIGHYGVILVGLRGAGDDMSKAVEQGNGGDVTFLRTYSEEHTKIQTWIKDKASSRFGMPETYRIDTLSPDSDDFPGGGSIIVHHTRIIHIAEGKLDSETFGTPRLEIVYNQFDNDMKVVGGGSEATWLNMRQGVAVTPAEGYDIDTSDTATNKFLDEIERYLHDPARVLRLVGMDAQQIGTPAVMEIGDISDVIISRISAATGIPQGKLKGSAAGELASAEQDDKRWAGDISSRQTNYAEPEILRRFIDKMVWYGVLPTPANGYDVGELVPGKQIRKWPSIIEQSEEEKAETRLKWAQAAKTLADPVTGKLPVVLDESREALGLPEAELPEGDLNLEALLGTLTMAKNSFDAGRGTSTIDDLWEMAMATIMDIGGE